MKKLWMVVLAVAGATGGGLVGDGIDRIFEIHIWLTVAGSVVGLIAGWYAGGWLADELHRLNTDNQVGRGQQSHTTRSMSTTSMSTTSMSTQSRTASSHQTGSHSTRS